MTIAQLVEYLRTSMFIDNPDVVEDSEYLRLTDDQIISYLNVAALGFDAKYPSLDYQPQQNIFPIVLLAKIALYHSLAVKEAPLYDLGADNNNYLKQDQRFRHYLALIEAAQDEYDNYLENGGEGGAGVNVLHSADMLLDNRYRTFRNYAKGTVPFIVIYTQEITDTTAEIIWSVTLNQFAGYFVYLSENPVLDEYSVGKKISKDATLVCSIRDPHQIRCRIENLAADTEYYIAVEARELSGIRGYAEVKIQTAEE